MCQAILQQHAPHVPGTAWGTPGHYRTLLHLPSPLSSISRVLQPFRHSPDSAPGWDCLRAQREAEVYHVYRKMKPGLGSQSTPSCCHHEGLAPTGKGGDAWVTLSFHCPICAHREGCSCRREDCPSPAYPGRTLNLRINAAPSAVLWGTRCQLSQRCPASPGRRSCCPVFRTGQGLPCPPQRAHHDLEGGCSLCAVPAQKWLPLASLTLCRAGLVEIPAGGVGPGCGRRGQPHPPHYCPSQEGGQCLPWGVGNNSVPRTMRWFLRPCRAALPREGAMAEAGGGCKQN
jgi:hypothetical protein